MISWILTLNVASTLVMAGLIWLVQLVHYPAFGFVSEAAFPQFAVFHQQRISLIVVPVMLLELVTTLLMIYKPHPAFPIRMALASAVCLAVVWFSTILLQMPVHQQFIAGKNSALIAELTLGNWWRTGAWSIRVVLLGIVLQRCAANYAAPAQNSSSTRQ